MYTNGKDYKLEEHKCWLFNILYQNILKYQLILSD